MISKYTWQIVKLEKYFSINLRRIASEPHGLIAEVDQESHAAAFVAVGGRNTRKTERMLSKVPAAVHR